LDMFFGVGLYMCFDNKTPSSFISFPPLFPFVS
jgi:hypothetical protein